MTVALRAFQVLTVTADVNSAGRVQRIPQSGSTVAYAATEISAGTSATIGPFSTDRNYLLTSTSGQLTYAITDGEPTATSSGLAASLSDETGSGAAVFGTGPTVTGATVTTSSVSGAVANLTTIGTGVSVTVPESTQAIAWNSITVSGTGQLTVGGEYIIAAYPS